MTVDGAISDYALILINRQRLPGLKLTVFLRQLIAFVIQSVSPALDVMPLFVLFGQEHNAEGYAQKAVLARLQL
jgi:hypothetical protein